MSFKDIQLGTPENFNALIEISKGSNEKYEYNPATDELEENFIFKNLFYPFNYGFIPQTDDGEADGLDVNLLSDPIVRGSVVSCRPIGMIEMIDRGVTDNKIIAVLPSDPRQSIKDIPAEELENWKKFYTEVARQKNKVTEIKGFHDKNQAIDEINRCKIK